MRDCTPVGVVRQGLYLPAGYVKANGATVDRADYPRLVRFATVNNLWTSDTTNNAGLFGVGDGTTTMVLPNWVGRMAQFSSDAGASVVAGLPNITGSICYRWRNTSPLPTGCFGGSGQGARWGFSEGTAVDQIIATLDASRSNAIYGASDTVQPASIKVLPVLRY